MIPFGGKHMYRKWRRITLALDLIAIAVVIPYFCFMRGYETVGTVTFIAAFLILIVSLILNVIKCRCPECGRYISEKYYPFVSYEHCPHCGADIHSWKYQ